MAKANISLLGCVVVVLLNAVSYSSDEASPAIFLLEHWRTTFFPETIFRADNTAARIQVNGCRMSIDFINNPHASEMGKARVTLQHQFA
ncbi:GDSL esterase/lipase-like protein [Salvia divinorum]|uniref:GDSL esterase/lipase-like protein n=1 Tax=Salvia divinorum TaxID=28513 RepID=A0ABD1HGS6_SALDI